MDKQKLESHLRTLREKHRRLDTEITRLDSFEDSGWLGSESYFHCEELKKQRLSLRDKISRGEKQLESYIVDQYSEISKLI